MTREALVWALLLPVVLAGATGLAGFAWGAALLALVFVYCQGRMLNAAKGIPAWREPLLLPLVLLTGLAEGSGLLLLAQPGRMAGQPLLLALIAVLLVARAAQWLAYRRRLEAGVAAPALRALEGAGRWLLPVGCVVPLLLLGLVLAGAGGPAPAAPMLIAAGVLAGAPGAWFKFVLITRAGFNQGFALKHLPVRGVSRGAF
jgi:phenylacetyl-CoA:acceptor oxidoreductase subunit 2